MKAEDLMVGDYVFWDWVTHKVDFDGDVMTDRGYEVSRRIIKVSSVNEVGVTFKSLKDGSHIYVKEEDLAPIPLTKEILEKNGFVKRDYETEMYFRLNDYSFEIHYEPKSKKWGIMGSEWVEFSIDYVHELQHTFKLYKIDKEIVL